VATTLKRIDVLRRSAFRKGGFNGFLILDSANLTYFTGFSGASGLLIPADGESIVYVYGVNYAQAKAELAGVTVELVESNEKLIDRIAKQTQDLKIENLAVDTLSIENWRALTKSFRSEEIIASDPNFIRDLRKVKDTEEIELMRRAAKLTSKGMRVACEILEVGMREYEVAAEIEYAMRKQGCSGTAFETIVASGVYSAFPHGGCSDRKIQKGDLVIIDVGATYKNYRSDMTRTLVAGKPSEKQKKLYRIVKNAQDKAFEVVEPKIKAAAVDAAARKIISDAGYGEFFVHSLGHGVGLEIHETPTLSRYSKDVLAAGNVVTLEPGIYLVGYGGIRIEDTILVQEKGAEKLTSGTYQLRTD
jgi:Xaa-Pro dipeptidase